MKKMIGIFGTAGMAKETQDIAEALGLNTVLIADNNTDLSSFQHDEVIHESDIDQLVDIPFVIGIGDPNSRKAIAEKFTPYLRFTNLVHPSATFGKGQREHIEQQQGVIISAGVRFTHNTSVSDFSIFNLNSTISHDCQIGGFVTVSPQACILGNVEIQDSVWIGANATINQGNEANKRVIGENTIIGSGTVVLDNCQANSTYVGNPARKIK